MCTALSLNKNDKNLFGRNLDVEISYGQKIVITPRNYEWKMRRIDYPIKQTFAMIGTAIVSKDQDGKDYPLYFDAMNEKGLACAGLNFPNLAYYPEPGSVSRLRGGLIEITPFELIPWILSNFTTVKEVKAFFAKNTVAFVNIQFSEQIPLAPLHFIVADKDGSIVFESTRDGLRMYDNHVGVLTNNPTFDWHIYNLSMYQNLLSEQSYDIKWGEYNLQPFGQGFGAVGLPGDSTPPSRFIKAVFNKFHSVCDDTLEALITQYFHIMDSVSMVKGTVIVRNQQNKEEVHEDITLYTSCMDLDSGVYYYKNYDNNRINAIDLFAEKQKLDDEQIIVYPFIEKQDINYLNKK